MARRQPIVVGNWKMNTTIAEAGNLAAEIVQALGDEALAVDTVLCPPFVSLSEVYNVVAGTPVALGAQNLHPAPQGAYTGEISWRMLEGLCSHVIVGHSERRRYFFETDEGVNDKVRAALEAGLTPIACVGEELAQRESGAAVSFVAEQVRALLTGLTLEAVGRVVIAYEPLWAIGTGWAASAESAQEMAAAIRAVVGDSYGVEAAGVVRVQYGGSVTGANAAEFAAQPDVDGTLVGGASLKPGEFTAIVRAFAAR